jgi:hypothetical protein
VKLILMGLCLIASLSAFAGPRADFENAKEKSGEVDPTISRIIQSIKAIGVNSSGMVIGDNWRGTSNEGEIAVWYASNGKTACQITFGPGDRPDEAVCHKMN